MDGSLLARLRLSPKPEYNSKVVATFAQVALSHGVVEVTISRRSIVTGWILYFTVNRVRQRFLDLDDEANSDSLMYLNEDH